MGHETTITVSDGKGKHFNIPSKGRRSGKKLTERQAISRARAEKLLGQGFNSVDEAVTAAVKRSKSFVEGKNAGSRLTLKDPSVTGGRVRRRHKLQGSRTPFNPGGKAPRGGGGNPKPRGKKK